MFSFFDFLFPAKCLNCKREGAFVCEKCFQQIQLKKLQCCPICKLVINQGEVCEKCRKKSALSGLLVATSYEKNPLIRKMITQFKYKFSEELSEQLGKLMLFDTNPLRPLFKGENTSNSVVLVPVPLHFFRKWKRGFNQAELLAKQISKHSGIPVVNLLKRIKNTPQQAKLKRVERLQNLKGAFAIKPRATSCELRADCQIILIDDVASTLTTLEESARTLKKAGFENIWGIVIARG